MRRMLFIIRLMVVFSLAGCGKEKEFKSAKKMEKLGRYPTAISKYDQFAEKNPKHSQAPESLFRIGEIYRVIFKDCIKARYYYEKITDSYPGTSWSDAADLSFIDCPEYFPLSPFLSRKMGDSQSGGLHMRAEESYEPLKDKPNRFKMIKEIFAGKTKVSAYERFYEKKERELREFQPENPSYAVIMRYPAKKDLKWETIRDGKRVIFTIEDDKTSLEVRGGVFLNCLKVKQQQSESKSTWKYDYYAPNTGIVLTSVATEKNETRVVELLSQTSSQETASSGQKFNRFLEPICKVKEWIKSKINKK